MRCHLQPRIRAIDKISTLAMYGLAASCIAEVMDLALRSLFAVGGLSGTYSDNPRSDL